MRFDFADSNGSRQIFFRLVLAAVLADFLAGDDFLTAIFAVSLIFDSRI